MRKTVKYALSASAVLCLVVTGAILPGLVAANGDRKLLEQIHSEPLDMAEMADYVNVSMVDKVGLLEQTTGASLVPLKTGAIYDQDTVAARFAEEWARLYALRFFPQPQTESLQDFRASATLYIQNDAPAINTIVWEITARTDSTNGVYFLDDQTGKILSYTITGVGFGDRAYTEAMAWDWEAYLGADMRNVKMAGQLGLAGNQATARTADVVLSFELFSGARVVTGQMRSAIQDGQDAQNTWSLHYSRVEYDDVITGE